MTALPLAERTPPASAWGIAWTGLAALAVAMGVGRFAFTPILPLMLDDSGLSMAEGGWLASANYAGYLLGALSAIVLRLRPVVAVRLALVLISLSTLAMGVEHGFAAWVVLRTVAGIASAWVLVFVSAWALERLAALERSDLGGTVYAGVGTGIAAAGGACLLLMDMGSGSATAWVVLGVASLAVTAVIWPVVAAPPVFVAAESTPQVQPSLSRAEYWRLVLCYGVFGLGYIIPATFLPVMAREAVSDPRLFGWAWPAFGAAAVASTLLAARMSRFLSHRGIWIAANLAMALGVALPVLAKGLPVIIVSALLVGGTFVVITMAGLQEARGIAGAQARALMGAMTASFAVGQILGPVAVSWLSTSKSGFAPALVVAGGLLAVSSFFLIPAKRVIND